MLTRAGIKKKRAAIIILWVIYSIAAGACLFILAQRKTADQAEKNLYVQANAIAGQIPVLLENSLYCETASRKMKTAKLEALVFALDDRKSIEEQRTLLDDFAAQADIAGLVVHDRNGNRIYTSKGAEAWTVNEQYYLNYSDQDEEVLYEFIRSEPGYLRKHYFSSDNVIDTRNPDEEPDRDFEEAEKEADDEDEAVSDLMTQYVSRLTNNGRWVVVTGNSPSETEQSVLLSFDWRSALGNVRIGESGCVLAIDENNTDVLLYGLEDTSGQTAQTMDIRIGKETHTASLEELKDAFSRPDQGIRISIGGKNCLATRVQADDVLMLAVLPEAEIRSVLSGELYMWVLLLLLMTGISVLYSWFHLSDAEVPLLRKRRRCTWNATLSGRLAACTILVVGTTFAAGLFMEFLSVHAQVFSSSRKMVSEVVDTYAHNQFAAENLLKWFQEENLDRCRVARTILSHTDKEDLNWDYLDELSEKLNVRYLYLYDDQGRIILTNSPYDRIVVNRENPFYALLEGRPEMALEPEKDSLSGEELLMTGVSVRDENHICTGLVVAAADEVELERIKKNLRVKNAFEQLCLPDGSRILIIDENGHTITANAEVTDGVYHNSVDGVDSTGYPAAALIRDETALTDAYNGKLVLNNKEYFASVVRWEKQFFVLLSPQQGISLSILIQTAVVAIVVLVFLLLLTVVTCLGKGTEVLPDRPEDQPDAQAGGKSGEKAAPVKHKEDQGQKAKSSEEEVMAVFGSIMNRKKPYFEERWPNDVIRWRDKEPGDKFSFLLKMILTFTFIAVLVHAVLVQENSLWHYVLDGDWNPGVNLHSITGCLLYICLLLILKIVIHKILFVIARAVNARGETICHLLDSASGYILGVIGIFICLSKCGVDTRSLSLSAGVAGVVFGIACQSTVADILSGVIMSLEGIVHVGDFLFFDGKPANVLSIGVRTTRLKFFSEITVVRNNEFKNFVLKPADQDDLVPAAIVIDMNESLERVEAIMEEELPKIHDRLCAISDNTIQGPNYEGVSRIYENGVELYFTLFCKGRYYMRLQRALNRELKLVCEHRHIAIAITQVMVTQR